MLKAILFDMDGVLVDSEDISIQVGVDYFRSIGKDVKRENFLSHLGTGHIDFFTGPAREVGLDDDEWSLDDAGSYFEAHFPEACKGHEMAMPGARETVINAKKAGLMVAVCSSASRWKVEGNIRSLGFEPEDFDLVMSALDVRRNKPYGDIYLQAMTRLGVDPEEAVVFEDAEGGVLAGLNAGAYTVALTTTMDGKTARHSGAMKVIKDLSDICDFSSAEELWRKLHEGIYRETLYGASYVDERINDFETDVLIEKCIREAKKARENAYAPYSNYHVGAAIVSAHTGKIYAGCNTENSSYGGTICAERNAITTAVAMEEGCLGIKLLIVVSNDYPAAPPCALCLQVIAEFAQPDTLVVLSDMEGRKTQYLFKELLPVPFIFPSMRK